MHSGIVALLLVSSLALSSALECFQCTSLSHPECLSHYEGHLKPCEPLAVGKFANKEAIGCRKIVQDIRGERSVVRECAYTGEKFDGKKLSGTSEVQVLLYQCSGDRCNSATTTFTSVGVVILSAVALVFRI